MKKIGYAFIVAALVSAPAFAEDSSTTTTQQQQQQYDQAGNSTTNTTTTNTYSSESDVRREVQIGGDYVFPYQVDPTSGRQSQLLGAHVDLFLAPSWAIELQGLFGIEDNGPADKPIFINPGMAFYGTAGRFIEPYFHANVPFLVNNGQDIGVGGGLGFLINLGERGLGLRYSFDGTYYFDAKSTSLNFANASLVFNW